MAQVALRQQVAHQGAIATGFGKGLLDALLATGHEDHFTALEAPVELCPESRLGRDRGHLGPGAMACAKTGAIHMTFHDFSLFFL